VTPRTGQLIVTGGALLAVAQLVSSAPSYMVTHGFPLDDAWIHAVYGRSLARSGALAYNPGVPATGATSPLWALVLAGPHTFTLAPETVVLLVKLIGLALHTGTVLALWRAFACASARVAEATLASLVVALHPDLVAASVSGMEVPLATLMAAVLLSAMHTARPGFYGLVSGLASLARPELCVLGFVLPLAWAGGSGWNRAGRLLVAAAAGHGLAFAVLGLRNQAVSGWPLPATFYAKVGSPGSSLAHQEWLGFEALLGSFAVTDSSLLLVGGTGASLWIVLRRLPLDAMARLAAAAFLGGISYCVVSFALIAPVDPWAFYHQRYVLPALPLMVAAIPILTRHVLERVARPRVAAVGHAIVVSLVLASVVLEAPGRFHRLANDAKNIDDVQVAAGRLLAEVPSDHVLWAVDAGAMRYFGNAFVVDLMGLNNAELLQPDAQRFLNVHAPDYIDVFPGWSRLDAGAAARFRGAHLVTAPYTVTSSPSMRERWIVLCTDSGYSGTLAVRARRFQFRCAGHLRDPA
jgi:hypothetical protein